MQNLMVWFVLSILGNFGQICFKKLKLFKLKFGTVTNLNMQNSVVSFIFICFRLEIPFLGKFGSKNFHFSEMIVMRRQYFHKISWNNKQEMTWASILETDFDIVLLFKMNWI